MATTGPSHEPEISAPKVWDFTDYRAYLEAYLQAKRHGKSGFSVRQFCLKAGISTENYLLKIIRGERNLGHKLAESFIRTLPLQGLEADYFRALVELGLSKDLAEKERFLARLENLRRRTRRSAPITDHSILVHWYLSAIWELASCHGFKLSPKSAVKALRNKVSVQQAKEAIEYLLRRGYLVEKDGVLIQGETPILTTNGRADPLLKLHHKEHVQAAVEAVDLPLEERGFFGLTIAIDKNRIPEVKTKIKAFMDQLQSDLALDPKADSVYRINAHFFPLAMTKEDKER